MAWQGCTGWSCTVGHLLRQSDFLLQGSTKIKSPPSNGQHNISNTMGRFLCLLGSGQVSALLCGMGLPGTAEPQVVLHRAKTCTK